MKTKPRTKRQWAVVPALVLLLFAPAALAAPSTADVRSPLSRGVAAGTPVSESGVVANPRPGTLPSTAFRLLDSDEDRISDGFQKRLAVLSPGAKVDVVVTFSLPVEVEAIRERVGLFGLKRQFRIIDGFSATMTAAQVKALSRIPGLFRIEEDFEVAALLNAATSDFGVLAARTDFAVNGSGTGICVIDTGVDPGHEQLDGGKVVEFADFVGSQTAAYDNHGHGTHVAAIAAGDGTGGSLAATYRGVAPGAAIYAAKALDGNGSGSESDVIAGVEWCADSARDSVGPGVRVLSLSLGSTGSSDGLDALSQAVNAAVADGKVVVVAAGNSGAMSYTIGSPGAAEDAVTVGAAAEWSAATAAENHSEGIYLASFSSRGPTADDRLKPDIVSPGVSITSAEANTTSGYVTWSGTSMATPFVSGSLALALARNPGLGPAALKQMLKDSASDRGLPGADNDWGAGLLDTYALVAGTWSDSGSTAFPAAISGSRNVADNSVLEERFQVAEEDLAVPIGITVTIDGAPECSLWLLPGLCWAEEWSPDLDARLLDPTGSVIAESICPADDDCGDILGVSGRQETLHAMPTVAGEYRVQVFPFAGDPNNGKGGDFVLDVSFPPVGGGDAPAGNQMPNVLINQPASGTVFGSGTAIDFVATADDAEDGDLGESLTWNSSVDGPIGTGGSISALLSAGDHTITAAVTDSGGLTDSDSVSITVESSAGNVNSPPVLTIVAPSDGSHFDSGNKIVFEGSALDAEDGNISGDLVWTSDGELLGSGASFTTRGRTSLSDGEHVIAALVTDSDGAVDSATITISVGSATEPPAGGSVMHVADIAMSTKSGGPNVNAIATVTVVDDQGVPVGGATVSGKWSGLTSDSDSGQTDGSGRVSFNSDRLKKPSGIFNFSVSDVARAGSTYDPGADIETSDSISAP